MPGQAAHNLGEWQAAALKALKGADPAVLTQTTEDGIEIAPLYLPDTEEKPALAPQNADFFSVARVDIPDASDAAAQIERDIMQDARTFMLVVDDGDAQRFGVKLNSETDVEKILSALPESVPLLVDGGSRTAGIAPWFSARPATKILHDPIGIAARHGDFAHVEAGFAAKISSSRLMHVDARLFQNAGASDAQEIGFALAAFVENLRQLEKNGEPVKTSLARHLLTMTADARQFASIIKLRAMHLVFAQFSENCGASLGLNLHVETSHRMLTAQDIYTNLIRTTLAAFSAIVGGATHISVLPFTSALGLPDSFARRMALNTLSILREESHAAMVQDAARGASYAEKITHELAAKAWCIFQDIERQGGLLAGLKNGSVQKSIQTMREARVKNAGSKKIVGVTAFPDPKPAGVKVLAKYAPDKVASPLALRLCRDTETFERAKSEAAA